MEFGDCNVTEVQGVHGERSVSTRVPYGPEKLALCGYADGVRPAPADPGAVAAEEPYTPAGRGRSVAEEPYTPAGRGRTAPNVGHWRVGGSETNGRTGSDAGTTGDSGCGDASGFGWSCGSGFGWSGHAEWWTE